MGGHDIAYITHHGDNYLACVICFELGPRLRCSFCKKIKENDFGVLTDLSICLACKSCAKRLDPVEQRAWVLEGDLSVYQDLSVLKKE
jgi:Leu/Phe-tRNA-protein transferase